MERRLAAILAADIVGYSRLTAPGETGRGGAGRVERWGQFVDCISGKSDDRIWVRRWLPRRKEFKDADIGTN